MPLPPCLSNPVASLQAPPGNPPPPQPPPALSLFGPIRVSPRHQRKILHSPIVWVGTGTLFRTATGPSVAASVTPSISPARIDSRESVDALVPQPAPETSGRIDSDSLRDENQTGSNPMKVNPNQSDQIKPQKIKNGPLASQFRVVREERFWYSRVSKVFQAYPSLFQANQAMPPRPGLSASRF